jgi:integrase
MPTFIPVETKKGISYKAYIRIKGYKPRCKTFSSITLAKKWAKKIESDMEGGEYKEVNSNELKIKTVEDLILYYKENIAPKKYSYAEKYDVMYDWWIDKVGKIDVVDLTSANLASCKLLLMNTEFYKGKHYSDSTINKYLFCFSAVLKWAVNELELIPVNPMSKVEHMKNLTERSRRLSEEEIAIFTNGCIKHSLDCLVFFLILQTTGGRYSEVEHLTVETIDFINSRVIYMNTKNKTNRSVAIDRRLLDLIKKMIEQKGIKSGYIFINKNGKLLYMRGVLQKIIKECGIEDCHIHDLRHTFASKGAENGASIYDIMVLLGHKSMAMAKRYTHLTQKYQDEVALKIANIMPVWSF